MIPVDGPRLSAEGLTVERGERSLLGGIGLELESGECLELVGPNGSGKTTLLRVLAGLVMPDTGEVRWCGEPISQIRPRYHASLHWLGHLDAVKLELSAFENLALFHPGTQAVMSQLRDFGLFAQAEVDAARLSAGQRRRLALAALGLRPRRLWLLDEPFTALDADGRALVREVIAGHLASGGMVVYSSHHEERITGARRLQVGATPDPALAAEERTG
jgi:heme exporter protein A